MNENNYIGILEDDAHYRRALEKLIESQDGYLVSLTANRGGELVELIDTLDLGSSAARRGGSFPFIRTEK